jgi:hypothetical protein
MFPCLPAAVAFGFLLLAPSHPHGLLPGAVSTGSAAPQQRPDTIRQTQAVEGYLVDPEAAAPVVAGLVTLLEGDEHLGSATTNNLGYFFLPVPRPGEYRLRVEAMGYTTSVSESFRIRSRDTVTVQLGVTPDAIEMEPLVVLGRTSKGMERFLDRMENWGKGIFLTPAKIDSIRPRHYADVFRNQEDIWLSWRWGKLSSTGLAGDEEPVMRGLVPNVRSLLGRGCMTYMVNQTPIGRMNRWILHEIDPGRIVAVEIYRYPGEVPPDLRNFSDLDNSRKEARGNSGVLYSRADLQMCGLTVYWTASGW